MFKIGDRVRLKPGRLVTTFLGRPPTTGVVVCASARRDVLIQFDRWRAGHGDYDNEWYIMTPDLEHESAQLSLAL